MMRKFCIDMKIIIRQFYDSLSFTKFPLRLSGTSET